MSIIRFRFRSAVNFDSVDIGEGKHSISVRDLKSKIVLNKNLNLCQDFDLLLSDALTGREYCDENIEVPAGSSVIIKRVPKGSVNSDLGRGETSENIRIKDGINEIKTTSTSLNLEVDNFDDFGAELCPSLEATTSDCDPNADNKLQFTINETTNEVTRCLETPFVGFQKPEASELSEATPRGPLRIDGNLDLPGTKSKSSVGEYAKPKMVVTANRKDVEIGCLPAELKCSLCVTFFKDAVMIPCCQHSFCKQCIDLVLIEKGRCPKCLSTKYKVEDLLPNVSLRQAIKHFLESQSLIRSSDNAFGYAPDGESGIQVKEMSCAVSIQQREAESPHSPCTTGQGSNQIISNAVGGKSSFSPKLRKIDAEKHGSMHSVFSSSWPENSAADFQAESTIKKRALHVQAAGADMSFVETGRYRKRDRTCFMCGSPDHLIRDCPAASSPHVMIQTGNNLFSRAAPGYMPAFCNGAPFHQISPFANPYGAHFNATMVPPANYLLPTYMPPMYGSMAAYRGSATIVGTAFTGPEWHLGQSDCQERAGYEKRQKLAHDNLLRGQYFDDDDKDIYNKRGHSYEIERLDHPRFYRDREGSGSHSKISSTERPHKKHRHHYHYDDELERSNSEVEDMPSSSSKHSEERHKYQHRKIKERGDGDSSLNHHRSTKLKDAKRKSGSDVKRDKQKRHGQSGSGLEPCLSIDQKRELKDRDSGHSSRHSKHRLKSTKSKQSHERWKMVSGSDEDLEDDNHYHNRKRHY